MNKVRPLEPWTNPFIKKDIISKLSFEEIKYLFGQKVFTQSDIICELLERIRRK